MKTGRCVRGPRANGAPLLGSRIMGKDSGGLDITRAYKPRATALAAIPDLKPIWQANSAEHPEQASDNAQVTVLQALQSNDMRQRIIAASGSTTMQSDKK